MGALARLAKHARRRTPGAVVTAPLRAVPVTDARTGTAHLVTDEAMAAGRRAGGRYSAGCGIEVLPASLTAPELRSSPGCVTAAAARPPR